MISLVLASLVWGIRKCIDWETVSVVRPGPAELTVSLPIRVSVGGLCTWTPGGGGGGGGRVYETHNESWRFVSMCLLSRDSPPMLFFLVHRKSRRSSRRRSHLPPRSRRQRKLKGIITRNPINCDRRIIRSVMRVGREEACCAATTVQAHSISFAGKFFHT